MPDEFERLNLYSPTQTPDEPQSNSTADTNLFELAQLEDAVAAHSGNYCKQWKGFQRMHQHNHCRRVPA